MISYAKKFFNSEYNLPELEANYLAVKSTGSLLFCEALYSVQGLLEKYRRLVLVLPQQEYYPISILQGFFYYKLRTSKEGVVLNNLSDELPSPGNLYITLSETDLAALIKIARQSDYTLGEELGILSLGDSPIKKCLSISVIDTYADQFSKGLNSYLIEQQQVRRLFNIILRNSF